MYQISSLLKKLAAPAKALLRGKSFAASVATLSTGTILAQCVSIGASPILTRLYSPAEIGTLATVVATTTILGIIGTGSYDLAVILPNEEEDANAVALLGLAIVSTVAIAVSLAFALFRGPLIWLLGLSALPRLWVNLIGVLVLLIGTENILMRLQIRAGRFRCLAGSELIQQIGTNAVKVVSGLAGSGVGGLFLGTAIGHVLRTAFLAYGERARIYKEKRLPDVARLSAVAGRYKRFPLMSTWSALLNSASLQVPVILFATLFSPAVAGYYAISHRILNLPMTFIGQNVGAVFMQRAARARSSPEELSRITLQIFKRLLLIGAAIMSFVTFYGDILFPFVLGAEWRDAGRYAQWISVWLVFVFAASPLSSIYAVLEKQGEALILNAVMFVSRVGIVAIGGLLAIEDYPLIIMFSIIGALVWLGMSARIMRIAHIPYLTTAAATLRVCIPIYSAQFMIAMLIRGHL